MTTTRSLALFLALALLALVLLALPISTARAADPVIVRVTTSGTKTWPCGDQSNWSNPCALQTALSNTVSGAELWVAAGTYTPTMGVTRTATFHLVDGVALYGGFAMTETLRTQRDLTANVTTLSGDIGTPGFARDNAYHVVTAGTGVTNTAVLDGFTVTGGRADANSFSADLDNSGGGMYNNGGSPALGNITFSGNSANQYGGGMYNNGGSPTLSNVTFSSNSVGGFFFDGYGGGMYNYNGSPTLSNVTFISNSTSVHGYGGGMYSDHFSNSTLTNVTFISNSASMGSGMYNYTGSPTLTNITFNGNNGSVGGGMYNWSGSPTLTSVVFSGNSGGGMYNGDSNATLTNVTFISNTSDGYGGGMFNGWRSNPTLTNVTFSGNSAKDGAGMYNYFSNPTLTGVTFSGNWATNDGSTGTYDAGGGGMYNDGSPTLTNVTFSGNSAINGGGMLDGGEQSSPTLTNVTFINNTASTSGGAMYNYGASPTLTNVTFSGNHATDGGGIYNDNINNYSNSTLTLTNTTFISNTASASGGGMFNDSSHPILTHVTFSGNSATVSGGGISNSYGSHPTVRNTIVWGNIAPTGSQIHNLYTAASLSDSVVQGGCPDGSGTCTHIITDDPLLGTLGNYGGSTQTIPLLPDSSAIDAGNDATCPTTDQRDKPRVGTCDIGAFESQGFTLTKASGDDQSTRVNTAFATPLRVTVSSGSGEPVNGGVVSFTAPSSGASSIPVTSTVVITSGVVTRTLTANGIGGSYAVTANTSGATAPATFALTNLLYGSYLPLIRR